MAEPVHMDVDENTVTKQPPSPSVDEVKGTAAGTAPVDETTRAALELPPYDPKARIQPSRLGKVFLVPLLNFKPEVDQPLHYPRPRAKFSGVITHIGRRLSMDVTGDNVIEVVRQIQPCHMGEAQSVNGSQFQHLSFVVDKSGMGFYMSGHLVATVVSTYRKGYKWQGATIDTETIRKLFNRLRAKEGDREARPLLPDAWYYRELRLRSVDAVCDVSRVLK